NPFFQHAEMQLWVATRGSRDIGRIAGILDRSQPHGATGPSAFFGFFETIDDKEVSRLLFQAVMDWARQKGAQALLGPANPTLNDECGLLVDGYDSRPVFMMTYNPRYYAPLIEAEGFQKAKDLLAIHIDLATLPMDRLSRIALKARARNPDLQLRPVRK